MKIGPTDHSALISTPAVSERKPAPARGPGQPEVVQSTRVNLSENVAIKANGEGSFDQAKVDRIAQSIRDGSFKVNAEAIADKLMANAQDLLGKSGG